MLHHELTLEQKIDYFNSIIKRVLLLYILFPTDHEGNCEKLLVRNLKPHLFKSISTAACFKYFQDFMLYEV